ncbi:MAG: hypothetical protein ACO1NO_08180 [Burkholderiaceae bacterium]
MTFMGDYSRSATIFTPSDKKPNLNQSFPLYRECHAVSELAQTGKRVTGQA